MLVDKREGGERHNARKRMPVATVLSSDSYLLLWLFLLYVLSASQNTTPKGFVVIVLAYRLYYEAMLDFTNILVQTDQ